MSSLSRRFIAGVVCLRILIAAAPARAQDLTSLLVYPANGAVNVDASQPFVWAPTVGATAYVLWIGTTPGAKDLVSSPEIQQTTYSVSVPGGALLYARLWTKIAGVWRSTDSTFTTAPLAMLVTPGKGALNVNPLSAFHWTPVTNAQAYVLWVGTSPGTHDVVYTPQVQATSYQPASGMPAAQLLYARMWTEVGGVWRSLDSTFTTAPSASITAPANGSVLTDPRPSFTWSTVAGAQAYYLYVGTSLGAKDLVNTGEIQATTYRPLVPLPSSAPLYVRLWTKWGGAWRSVDTQLTILPAAWLTAPVDGAVNINPRAQFNWTAVSGAQAYYLYVGTQPGAKDVVNTGETQAVSYLAPSLPIGRLLFARIWTKISGAWRFVDSSFTTATTAWLTAPADKSVATDPRPVFSWAPITGADAYALTVGRSAGASDVVNTGEMQATTYQPSGPLPTGVTLYVRLSTKFSGAWQSVDTQFTIKPMSFLTTPADGATNVAPNVRFTWTAVSGAQAYYLYVGTHPGATDVINTGELHTTSYSGASMPVGQALYARMWVKTDAWRYVDSQFTTVKIAELIAPLSGTTNIDPNATLTWTPSPGAQAYRLTMGSAAGLTDVFDSGSIDATFYRTSNLPGGVPLYARLWTEINGAWFHSDAIFTAAAILDDFSEPTIRRTTSGEELWSHYDEGAPGSVQLTVNGTMQEIVLLGNETPNSGGAYFQFVPKANNSYVFPDGYARRYIQNGSWNPDFNRLTFRMRVNRTITGTSDHVFEVGTYVRPHADTDVGDQGSHFYHFLSPNLYDSRWVYVTINRVPQHKVAEDSNLNWGENPTGDPYFDDLTRFYIDDVYQMLDGASVEYDDFKFGRVDGEPDTLVSNTTAEYTGSRYEISFNTPKWVDQTYEISYSTTSLNKIGFEQGTYGGWVQSQGSAYTWVRWASPNMAEAPAGLFIAIRPVGHTEFTELYVPAN